MEAVNGVLDELGIAEKSRLLLLNKIDRIQDPSIRVVLAGKFPDAIFLSAATGENAEKVIADLSLRMSGQDVTVELLADVTNGRLMQFLSRYAQMSNQAYEGKSVTMTAKLKQRYLDELRQFEPAVEIR
jgi:GTP-binding protein HflX